MDIITTAIITALVARKAGSAAEPDQKMTIEAYSILKTALRQKFGVSSDTLESLELLERQPTSTGRQAVLREELTRVRAEQDSALRLLAQSLLDKLQTKHGGTWPVS